MEASVAGQEAGEDRVGEVLSTKTAQWPISNGKKSSDLAWFSYMPQQALGLSLNSSTGKGISGSSLTTDIT